MLTYSFCLICKFRKSKPEVSPLGDLPLTSYYRKAHFLRSLTYTGIDYFQPMEATTERRKEKKPDVIFIHVLAHELSILNWTGFIIINWFNYKWYKKNDSKKRNFLFRQWNFSWSKQRIIQIEKKWNLQNTLKKNYQN